MLVVVAIVAVLLAMLLPSLAKARYAAQLTVCSGNLRQLVTAVTTYATDFQGNYPNHYFEHNNSKPMGRYPAFSQDWLVTTGLMKNYSGMNRALYYCPIGLQALRDTDQPKVVYDRWPNWYRDCYTLYGYFAGDDERDGLGSWRGGPLNMQAAALDRSTLLADVTRYDHDFDHDSGPRFNNIVYWNHNPGRPWAGLGLAWGEKGLSDEASVNNAYADGHVKLHADKESFIRHHQAISRPRNVVTEQPHDMYRPYIAP